MPAKLKRQKTQFNLDECPEHNKQRALKGLLESARKAAVGTACIDVFSVFLKVSYHML